MNHKELRYSFNFVLDEVEKITCESLHHKTSHQHEPGTVCPAEYQLHKHIQAIKDYMKQNNI